MAWPMEIREKILAEARRVFKKPVSSISGQPVPAVYQPSAAELKAFFLESEAIKVAEPIQPFVEAIRKKNKPPRLHGKYISWCGIFAVWVYKKALIPQARWIISKGPHADGMKIYPGYAGVAAGDIAVIKGREFTYTDKEGQKKKGNTWHHFLVVNSPDFTIPEERIWSIDGNTEAQLIRQRKMHRLRTIEYYYSFDGSATPLF